MLLLMIIILRLLIMTIVNNINELCKEYRECNNCVLGNKNNWSWPRGNPALKKMIIGEAPGKTEVETRRFFTGRAGKLLNELYEKADVDINTYYITNAVKCRPVAPKGSGKQNNTPTTEYVEACRPILDREIIVVNPTLIVTLGRTATERVLSLRNIKMGQYVGKGQIFADAYTSRGIFPMYHPSFLLRNQSKEFRNLFVEHIKQSELLFNRLKEFNNE